MIGRTFLAPLALLGLVGCVSTEDSSNPAPQAEVVWDVDSDGRMELLSRSELWSFDSEGLATIVNLGTDFSFFQVDGYWRSRGPRAGGAGAVLLVGDRNCATDSAATWPGVRALAVNGLSECVLGEMYGHRDPVAVLSLQQADGPECLIRSRNSDPKPEIGCTTSSLGFQGWASLAIPSELDGRRWRPCGGVVRPAGEVGVLICTDRLIGWASAPVDGGDLHYVEFSSIVDAGNFHGEDPRFPNHFVIGAGNSVDQPPDVPTRFCEVSDWDAGKISCVVIDAQDAISSLQLMRLEPGQSTPAVFIRSEKGERQWLYSEGERREVTVAWPDRSPYGPNGGTLTVLDADGDGVDELAVQEWFESAPVVAPVLLEFDGDAAFVPVTPP